jgi:ribosomal protein S21
MLFDRFAAVARRAMSSALAGPSSSSTLLGARWPRAAASCGTTTSSSGSSTTTTTAARGGDVVVARRGVITIPVDNGDAERAYKRLRKIMVSEGIYKELRESTMGHRKPAELRVLARKERERRTRRSKLNSKLGWIMRQKERGF